MLLGIRPEDLIETAFQYVSYDDILVSLHSRGIDTSIDKEAIRANYVKEYNKTKRCYERLLFALKSSNVDKPLYELLQDSHLSVTELIKERPRFFLQDLDRRYREQKKQWRQEVKEKK